MTTLFVGIDVSQNVADVCFLDRDERDLGRLKITNDLPGAEQLVRRITSFAKQRQLSTVVIGLEATGMLGWHLRTYLSQIPVAGHVIPHSRGRKRHVIPHLSAT